MEDLVSIGILPCLQLWKLGVRRVRFAGSALLGNTRNDDTVVEARKTLDARHTTEKVIIGVLFPLIVEKRKAERINHEAFGMPGTPRRTRSIVGCYIQW
jgi:hypothetical protein